MLKESKTKSKVQIKQKKKTEAKIINIQYRSNGSNETQETQEESQASHTKKRQGMHREQRPKYTDTLIRG